MTSARWAISNVAWVRRTPDFLKDLQFCTGLFRIVQGCTEFESVQKISKWRLFGAQKQPFPPDFSKICSGTIRGTNKMSDDVRSRFSVFSRKCLSFFKFRRKKLWTTLNNSVQLWTTLYKISKIMIWVARCLYCLSVGMGTHFHDSPSPHGFGIDIPVRTIFHMDLGAPGSRKLN